MSGLCRFADASFFGDGGSLELLAYSYMGGMVLKTQSKKTERTSLIPRLGSPFCWIAQSLLCFGFGFCGSITTGWAQQPVGPTPVDTTPVGITPSVAAPQGKLPEPPAEESETNLADLKQLGVEARKIFAASAEAVVSMDGGSGVIVSEDGWVMTASHVCESPGRKIEVRLSNGILWPAQTFGVDRQKDTGMVKLEGDHNWPFVSIDQQAKVKPGDWCVVMGYPWDEESLKTPAVRIGRITAIENDRIVTDVPIIGGDSGGPVFNTSGDLLAINSRIRLDVHQNIHIPVMTFVGELDALTRAEFVRAVGIRKNRPADPSLPAKFGRDALEVQQALAALLDKIEPSVVRLVSVEQGEDRAEKQSEVLGTIVSASGLVVAKLSDLQPPVQTQIGEDWVDAEVVSFDEKTDLALLQLSPKKDMKFVPVQNITNLAEENLIGRLILSVKKNPEDSHLEASLGTMMVAPQTFAKTSARQQVDLGLVFEKEKDQSSREAGMDITRVYPKSLADQSGLRNGDRLVSIDGRDVINETGLKQILAKLVGGQTIRFSILRQGELLSFRVRLPNRLPLVWDRWGGGPFSGRRFGFGTVIAHDAVIDPSDCGGPVIDLAGNFVGINVSRAMRTTTYAVPAKTVLRLVEEYQQSQ
ncbi:trypsin-like peptidase domain-containing protein [Mariniblastus sp.]|nr:trypsin-like peptidase domain-containing protein [Mariniblastus sp.]